MLGDRFTIGQVPVQCHGIAVALVIGNKTQDVDGIRIQLIFPPPRMLPIYNFSLIWQFRSLWKTSLKQLVLSLCRIWFSAPISYGLFDYHKQKIQVGSPHHSHQIK